MNTDKIKNIILQEIQISDCKSDIKFNDNDSLKIVSFILYKLSKINRNEFENVVDRIDNVPV